MRKIAVCLMMLVVMASVASAKEGFYIGGQIPYNMVKGDFDDTTWPKLKSGAGFGLIAGYTFPINLAVEVDYAASRHQSDSKWITGSAGLAEFSLNGKYSFMTTELQPYILAGVGSFATGQFVSTTGSFILLGTGYNLGVGADYYVSPNVSIGAGIIQKFITYTKTDNSSVTLSKDIKGDTTSVRFDVAYHF